MRMPRGLAQAYAYINGYFWLPCPICGENFGGFEHGDEPLMRTATSGTCVCDKESCNAEARRRNAENFPGRWTTSQSEKTQ